MRSAHWRGMALSILSLTAAACSKPDARANAADPNTPAVVKAPPVVLASDTAKKPDSAAVSMLLAKTTTARNYAILGFAISRGDLQMVGAQYSPEAKLTTPSGTYAGKNAIAHLYAGLVGLKTFQRTSRMTTLKDSTVADSGTYTMVIKRAGAADSSVEHGSYSSLWRVHPEPLEWVMWSDHLYPVPRKAK
jgi:hypothetical protein